MGRLIYSKYQILREHRSYLGFNQNQDKMEGVEHLELDLKVRELVS